jgi:hypothetical protein
LPAKLTFYGEVNEVGGNKILLDDKDTRILLDFGKGFSRRAKYLEEYLSSPRIANGIVDFIGMMDLIPDVEGIYRDDLLEMAGRLPWIEAAQKSWRPGGKSMTIITSRGLNEHLGSFNLLEALFLTLESLPWYNFN